MKFSEVFDRYRVTYEGYSVDYELSPGKVVVYHNDLVMRFDDQEIQRLWEGAFVVSKNGHPEEFRAWVPAPI